MTKSDAEDAEVSIKTGEVLSYAAVQLVVELRRMKNILETISDHTEMPEARNMAKQISEAEGTVNLALENLDTQLLRLHRV